MRRILLPLVLLFALTGAMQLQPFYGPNGNGTLDHEDDLRWVLFHGAKIAADEKKGIYTATFSPSLAKMNGHSLSITGYMLPIETGTRVAHFILTRRSSGCPFCPPNEPTEAIEIFSAAPVDYTQAPVTIEGQLHLVARSELGLFYRLDHAKVKG